VNGYGDIFSKDVISCGVESAKLWATVILAQSFSFGSQAPRSRCFSDRDTPRYRRAIRYSLMRELVNGYSDIFSKDVICSGVESAKLWIDRHNYG
jgi:hypothetical protein